MHINHVNNLCFYLGRLELLLKYFKLLSLYCKICLHQRMKPDEWDTQVLWRLTDRKLILHQTLRRIASVWACSKSAADFSMHCLDLSSSSVNFRTIVNWWSLFSLIFFGCPMRSISSLSDLISCSLCFSESWHENVVWQKQDWEDDKHK